jgi:hypothetical protein
MANKKITKLTIEEIKQALYEFDLRTRPYIAFLNPEDAEAIKDCLPKIEEEIVIFPTSHIEKGQGIALKREDFELFGRMHFDNSNKSL